MNMKITDRSRYYLRYPNDRGKVWRRTDERFAEYTLSARLTFQGGWVMVLYGLSVDSRTNFHLVARGAINAERYKNESSLC